MQDGNKMSEEKIERSGGKKIQGIILNKIIFRIGLSTEILIKFR
jgi:hypothetical protein